MKSLIRNTNQVKQAIDFTGLQNGKIHPTDIDAVLEFNNKHLILIEVKKEGNKFKGGQLFAYQNICNAWNKSGKIGIILFITHNFKDDTKNIPLSECNVEEYYIGMRWYKAKSLNLIYLLNKLGEKWGIDKLKINK